MIDFSMDTHIKSGYLALRNLMVVLVNQGRKPRHITRSERREGDNPLEFNPQAAHLNPPHYISRNLSRYQKKTKINMRNCAPEADKPPVPSSH